MHDAVCAAFVFDKMKLGCSLRRAFLGTEISSQHDSGVIADRGESSATNHGPASWALLLQNIHVSNAIVQLLLGPQVCMNGPSNSFLGPCFDVACKKIGSPTVDSSHFCILHWFSAINSLHATEGGDNRARGCYKKSIGIGDIK